MGEAFVDLMAHNAGAETTKPRLSYAPDWKFFSFSIVLDFRYKQLARIWTQTSA
jgi:hypothetical protein